MTHPDVIQLREAIDDVAGIQLAQNIALQLMLTAYQGDTRMIAALKDEFEKKKANLLTSSSSDRKLSAFDTTAAQLIGLVAK
jgi:hypothetical protein